MLCTRGSDLISVLKNYHNIVLSWRARIIIAARACLFVRALFISPSIKRLIINPSSECTPLYRETFTYNATYTYIPTYKIYA